MLDSVIRGGMLIDGTGRPAILADVGVKDGRIADFGEVKPAARRTIDATGRAVAPGFIDIHAHGQTTADMEIQAHDGVTTALDLEAGVYPVAAWYDSMAGRIRLFLPELIDFYLIW